MLVYEVRPSRIIDGYWVAEAINTATEERYAATFGGPDAEKRARDYAAWMNGTRETKSV